MPSLTSKSRIHPPSRPGISLPDNLLVLPYENVEPYFAGSPIHCGEAAAVLGRVTIGTGARLGSFSVIRADGHYVKIGSDFHLGPRSTVHIMHELYPAIVGDRVAVGANACVHACTVGSDCVIEDDAVVLDGSVVEDEVIVERKSVAFPRSRLERGHVYAGSPAKPIRSLAPGEIAERRKKILREYGDGNRYGNKVSVPAVLRESEVDPTAFIARTANVRGRLRAEAGSSVWFSCDFDAGDAPIVVGTNTNVQDNTVIRCSTRQGVTMGRNSAIGHNVLLRDCVIGDEALVGIGSIVEQGTVIRDRVLLAAGARTAPGQVLDSGWLWGGNPARQIARLDSVKQKFISFTVETYLQYANAFMTSQERMMLPKQPGARA